MVPIRKLLLLILLTTGIAAGAHAAGQPLTRADVKKWLRTEIGLTRLQRQYKRNAAQYDDVVHAFFLAKAKYVRAHGYPSDAAFDAIDRRIMAAMSAMDEQADIDKRRAERARKAAPAAQQQRQAQRRQQQAMMQQEMAQLRRSNMLSEAQKRKMLARMQQLQHNARQYDPQQVSDMQARADRAEEKNVIAPTRPDWPAVRPYRAKIRQFVQWYDENTPNPPTLE